MKEIGVRELKASLSEILRAAGRGQEFRITSRGHPLADLLPAGASENRLRHLMASGKVSPPSRSRPPRPPRLARGRRSASSLVIAEREAER